MIDEIAGLTLLQTLSHINIIKEMPVRQTGSKIRRWCERMLHDWREKRVITAHHQKEIVKLHMNLFIFVHIFLSFLDLEEILHMGHLKKVNSCRARRTAKG